MHIFLECPLIQLLSVYTKDTRNMWNCASKEGEVFILFDPSMAYFLDIVDNRRDNYQYPFSSRQYVKAAVCWERTAGAPRVSGRPQRA